MKIVNRSTGFLPNIFDELFLENGLDVPNYENFSIPKVNIRENFTNFAIALAVPGRKREDFSVEIEKRILKVSANNATNKQTVDKDTKVLCQEFDNTRFTRSFKLPETVQTENITASYKDGILDIVIPKMEPEKQLKRMVEIS